MTTLIALTLSIILTATTWLTHTDDRGRYSIKYPEQWEKTMQDGYVTFLSSVSDSNDNFRENVNVMIQDASAEPITLEQYTQVTKDWIFESAGQAGLISEKDIQLSGLNGHELHYKLPGQAMDFSEPLYFYQAYAMKGTDVFLLTYSGTEAQFNEFLPVAKEAFASFKVGQ